MAKHGDLTLNEVEAIVNKMGGIEAARRFLRNELVVKAVERSFKVFKTITLGLHKTADAYRKALETDGYRIGDYAGQILKKIEVAQTETQVDLVVLTVAELGFKDGARRDAIYAKALEFGLQLCPAEVGPALCLVYKDQPRGEWLRIGMEPLAGSGGYLRVFVVGNDDGDRWLYSSFGYPDDFWRAGDRWVFVAPRK